MSLVGFFPAFTEACAHQSDIFAWQLRTAQQSPLLEFWADDSDFSKGLVLMTRIR